MLLPAPPLFPRKRKGRAKAPSTPPPPPAALTLAAATYQLDDSPFTVSLEFDRAIDIGAFNGSQVTVKDGGINSVEYRATGPASLLDPTTLRVAWAPRPLDLDEGKDVGEAPTPREEPVGYCIGNDQYFKHDDIGIIYQLNVLPGKQRGLIGAALVQAMFDRAAYGCKLFCCWCA